jgi:hypothetical protein
MITAGRKTNNTESLEKAVQAVCFLFTGLETNSGVNHSGSCRNGKLENILQI